MTLLEALNKGQFETFFKILIHHGLFISGVEQVRNMSAVNTGTPTGAAQVIDDVTGFKTFTVTINPAIALGASESIVISYGNTAGDTGVEANAVNYTGILGSPNGQVYNNIVVLNSENKKATIKASAGATIKRIAGYTDGSANRAYNIVTVG